MRNPTFSVLACLSALSLVLATGCGDNRNSMMAVPDRGGHAYSVDGTGGAGTLTNQLLPVPGEKLISIDPKDTLSSLAVQYHTTTMGIIRRNDLEHGLPAPGTSLIVPDNSAPLAPVGPSSK
jgi:LysM repeat protein